MSLGQQPNPLNEPKKILGNKDAWPKAIPNLTYGTVLCCPLSDKSFSGLSFGVGL